MKRQARETNRRVAAALGWEKDCVFVEGTIAGASLAFPDAERRRRGDQSPGKSEPPEVDLRARAARVRHRDGRGARPRGSMERAPLTLVAPCCHHDLQTRVRRIHSWRLRSRRRSATASFARGSATSSRTRSARTSCDCWGTGWTWWSDRRGEHTPRNTMIRAVRTNARAAPALWREYDEMRELWGVTPWLAEALAPRSSPRRGRRRCGTRCPSPRTARWNGSKSVIER